MPGRALALLLLPALLSAPAALAAEYRPQPALYLARAITTGTDARERPEALARCLRDALVQVSGDPALADDPRAEALAPRAAEYVHDLVYLDRMTDIPHHDEQGSRDRPYDLIVRFDPARLDAALASLGARPWLGPRPDVLVRVTVTERSGDRYPLAADGDSGERQRRALLAAAERYGLLVVLPTEAEAATPPPTGAVVLSGSLEWREAAHGWVGSWRLAGASGGAEPSWGISGVSFDEAFRDAMRGALQVLSGHGMPD